MTIIVEKSKSKIRKEKKSEKKKLLPVDLHLVGFCGLLSHADSFIAFDQPLLILIYIYIYININININTNTNTNTYNNKKSFKMIKHTGSALVEI